MQMGETKRFQGSNLSRYIGLFLSVHFLSVIQKTIFDLITTSQFLDNWCLPAYQGLQKYFSNIEYCIKKYWDDYLIPTRIDL